MVKLILPPIFAQAEVETNDSLTGMLRTMYEVWMGCCYEDIWDVWKESSLKGGGRTEPRILETTASDLFAILRMRGEGRDVCGGIRNYNERHGESAIVLTNSYAKIIC